MNSYSEIIRNHKEMIPISLLKYFSENFRYSKFSSGKLTIGAHVQPYPEEVSFYFDSSNRITVRFQFFDNLEEFLDDIEIACPETEYAIKRQVQIALSEIERVLKTIGGTLEYSHHLSQLSGWWDIMLPNKSIDVEILEHLFTYVNEIFEVLQTTEKEVYCD